MMDGEYGHMGGGSMICMLIVAVLLIIPFWKILPRSGIPSWVALFAAFPPIGLILLWVVAFKKQSSESGGAI